MSFRGLLRHSLAIVTPGVPDLTDLDDAGFPVVGDPVVVFVKGLVQPRSADEVPQPLNAGAERADFEVFLEMMNLSPAAYITDANDDGDAILSGGRRFQIVGIKPFDYGRDPHLEVDVKLIGSTEPLRV